MSTTSPTSSPDPGAAGGVRPGTYYGYGIPYLPIDGYPGKIIALEGTDGVGRSTQIRQCEIALVNCSSEFGPVLRRVGFIAGQPSHVEDEAVVRQFDIWSSDLVGAGEHR